MAITLQPLDAAVEFLRRKTPVTSPLRTDGWERVALGLRERAQFSAGVENVRIMAFVQAKLEAVISQSRTEAGTLEDRGKFVRDLMRLADDEGARGPGPKGSIADIGSESRANLIYQTQISQAYGYAQWQGGQDASALEAAPAQELIRLEERNQKRNWHERWRAAGGTVFPGVGIDGLEGRLVALKTDPVWSRLSRFGSPWPPYDFNSGTWVQDVFWDEAVQLGLLTDESPPPEPVIEDFNADLVASANGIDEPGRAWLKDAFGDQVQFVGHDIRWQGSMVQDYVERVLDRQDINAPALNLGGPSVRLSRMAMDAGVDLTDRKLLLEASRVRHVWQEHSIGERNVTQRRVRRIDFELIPHVWREPDSVRRGAKPGSLVLSKKILGKTVAITNEIGRASKRVTLGTMYVKK